MAIYYTDTHESHALLGDHDNLLDYRDECQAIAAAHFKSFDSDSMQMVIFDFYRNESMIFEFTAETIISCTAY